MTALDERIRRERELIHALELLRRRAPDARELAMKAGVAIKVAGWDIRFYTFDLDSRQHYFLGKPGALSYLYALRDDSLYDIFQKGSKTNIVRQNCLT